MKFLLTEYETRRDLEDAIRVSGDEPKDSTIQGTHEDLERFGLSPVAIVHGVRCLATDKKKDRVVPAKGAKAKKKTAKKKAKK